MDKILDLIFIYSMLFSHSVSIFILVIIGFYILKNKPIADFIINFIKIFVLLYFSSIFIGLFVKIIKILIYY